MDHIANWVRFADSKATILAAGLAATLALLGGRLDAITSALGGPCNQYAITLGLGIFTLGAVLWTVYWLISAINPRNDMTDPGLNRFAWPTMANAKPDEIMNYASRCPADEDAWKQAADLARIAKKKFRGVERAAYGFAVLLLTGIVLVVYTALAA